MARVLRARIAGLSGGRPGEVEALVLVELPWGEELVRVERLARRPAGALARLEGRVLVVDLVDEGGQGFASCVVDVERQRPPWSCEELGPTPRSSRG